MAHVKKGDTVTVIAGNHRGQQGKVLAAGTERVVVEGIRMIKKHVRRSPKGGDSGIVEKEGTIHISNVKVIEAAAQ
jgi:large subunit ribosomal protein L24